MATVDNLKTPSEFAQVIERLAPLGSEEPLFDEAPLAEWELLLKSGRVPYEDWELNYQGEYHSSFMLTERVNCWLDITWQQERIYGAITEMNLVAERTKELQGRIKQVAEMLQTELMRATSRIVRDLYQLTGQMLIKDDIITTGCRIGNRDFAALAHFRVTKRRLEDGRYNMGSIPSLFQPAINICYDLELCQ